MIHHYNYLPAQVVVKFRGERLALLAGFLLDFLLAEAVLLVLLVLARGFLLERARAAFKVISILLGIPFLVSAVELLVIVVRHQFRFDILDDFLQVAQKTVEVFLVEENLVLLVFLLANAFARAEQIETALKWLEKIPLEAALRAKADELKKLITGKLQ